VKAGAASTTALLPSDWQQRVQGALLSVPDREASPWRADRHPPELLEAAQLRWPAAPIPAAVLVPIGDWPAAPTLLFTTRAGHMRRHAGQVSFPGGRLEASDGDPVAAALRETHEETGIEAAHIRVMGFLPDQVVLTGYRVTPVVALVRPGFVLRRDASEVAEIFEMPLARLVDPGSFQDARRQLYGVEVTLRELHFDGRIIWGATGVMLQALHDALARVP
jgi:8-oxo-dGTP pyrophosphatase MutT (NUDIX family)